MVAFPASNDAMWVQWYLHRFVGDRKDAWSLSVTKNWRIAFRIDRAGDEIVELDYEDYH